MALMAELPNGTMIGIRGCRVYTMAGCNSSVVCNSENETMPLGARFKRCVGECCSSYLCNQGLYPVLAPVTPEPASSYANVLAPVTSEPASSYANVLAPVTPEPASSYASVMATSSRTPTSSTNGKKPGPTSTAAALLGPYHWLIVSVSAPFLPSM